MKKMKVIGFSFFVVALVVICSSGGSQADQWVKTYGGSGNAKANSIQQSSDGGYIVAGHTQSLDAGSQDIWILKLDVSGNIQWQKTYGGNGSDEATSIQQTSDGGYVVAGSTTSSGTGAKDIWVSRLDQSGNIQWQKTYGGISDDEASAILQTPDEKYLVVGSTYLEGASKKDLLVMRLDKDGNIEWQRAYGGGTGDDVIHSMQQTSDGKYILAGSTESYGTGRRDVWILKLDKDGNIEWQKAYGLTGYEEAYSIQETSDGGYIAAGWTSSYAIVRTEGLVLKLDSDGKIIWQTRTYGGNGNDIIYAVRQTLDGNYILAGSTDSHGAGKKDVWILKLNASENRIEWQKTLGGTGDDETFYIQEAMDRGFVAAGWSNSFGAGNYDALIIKIDNNGEISGCPTIENSNASFSSTDVSVVPINASPKDTGLSSQAGNLSSANTEATPGSICMVAGPEIAVDPISIDYGPVVMGSSSSQTITVMNVGSTDLVMGTPDIIGTNHLDFGIRDDGCSSQTLKSLARCTVEVGFSPGGNGERSAILSIPSNDSDFTSLSVSLKGEAVPPISPSQPPNRTSFSACSLYEPPTFAWDVEGSFKSYEIQFSKAQDFNTIGVRVKTSINPTMIKSSTWKRVFLIPGTPGGPVYWRVYGIFAGGKTGFVSYDSSMTIEPAQPVKGAQISPIGISSLPTLSWESDCSLKFKVWFGNDDRFDRSTKKYSISYTIKNPLDGEFSQQLTSSQWDTIRKLVGDRSGATIHWKVESWDGANRETQTAPMSLILGE